MPVRDLLSAASGASTPATYIDDIFSTYLYTGNGTSQTITNNIDLTDNGGMVWIKNRTNTGLIESNALFDTVRGVQQYLISNTTVAQSNYGGGYGVTSFNTNGFQVTGDSSSAWLVNFTNEKYASWTFRKAPKFFDVVQYTGTGSAQAINHSLGSVPGCIIVKDTSNANAWSVYHKGLNGGTTPQNYYAVLNTTAAQVSSSALWNNTAPTSTQFTVGTDATVNASGQTYIAYIFADQAGGFGATGTDSAIACGSFTTDGLGNSSTSLGWEPQYVLMKRVSGTGDWFIQDVIRGMPNSTSIATTYLAADTAGAETTSSAGYCVPTATGFTNTGLGFSSTYIYIAIRRSDKPPTTGTSVFAPVVQYGGGTVTTGFPVDLSFSQPTTGGGNQDADRLRGCQTGTTLFLQTDSTAQEGYATGFGFDNNTGYNDNNYGTSNIISYWNFRRAPTFFDEVCYTGTGSATTQTHNLTVVPEMMIVKDRTTANNWWVYHSATGNTKYSVFNTTAIPTTSSTAWNNTTPTSSVFSIGTDAPVNTVSDNYVAYLFATCAGVSKVGSFTGTAGTQSIACGFGSGGARFILIKRTNSTGNWYVFDSANGLTSSSSPYMTWNTANAQTTGNNGCYASSGGFTLTSAASSTVNINGGSYIFLAVA